MYSVSFPDLPVVTCGTTLEDSFLMACDVLHCLFTYSNDYPPATPLSEVALKEGEIALLVRPAIYPYAESKKRK